MIAALIPAITSVISTAIDRLIPDKEKAEKVKAQITMAAMQQDLKELEAAANIIVAEANGESWLQRNWRPLVMLFLSSLVGAHWLGYTAPNLSDGVVMELLAIVKVGLGGYVLGRSGEKIMKEYKRGGG